ncbi:MAG: hypothetical protein INR62_12955, partial [Rhodospirillales bacterium]|nr:hypothetical protein [Acetobacter sp.]
YAANDAYNYPEANRQLQRSLSIAQQIPSTQLEVRSLAQLSSVAYNDSKDDQAIAIANQVIDTARDNGLEYWVSDGLVRLGNAFLDKEDYVAAEQPLQDAIRRARENNHPRLQATAGITLASLRAQQRRWDEVVHYARPAQQYFENYGFAGLSDQALQLLARAAQSKGDYAGALAIGTQLLRSAEQSHSSAYILLAEESIGFTLFRLQHYPEALQHFDHALEQAALLKEDVVYVQLARADLLWQLGRYAEANAILGSFSSEAAKRTDVGLAIASTQANMLNSEGEYREALRIAREAQLRYASKAGPTKDAALSRALMQSYIHLDQRAEAQQSAAALQVVHGGDADEWETAANGLAIAMLDLQHGDFNSARNFAQQAEAFFAQKNIAESDALCFYVAAEAADATGEQTIADEWSKKSVDIFQGLEQSWGVRTFHQYLARPDRQQLFRS